MRNKKERQGQALRLHLIRVCKRGFTLAELLIVMAIIGILAAIGIILFSTQLEKANEAADIANLRSAKAAAISRFLSDDMSDGTFYFDAQKGVLVSRTELKANGISGYGRGTIKTGNTNNTFNIGEIANGSVIISWVDIDGKSNEDSNNYSSDSDVRNKIIKVKFIDETKPLQLNILETGNEFKNHIQNNTTSVTFTDIEVPDGVTTIDVSATKNGSVLAWYDGTDMYVTTADEEALYANTDSSYMFYGKSYLKSITFDNFNINNITNIKNMFAYSGNLKTIFASDWTSNPGIQTSDGVFSGCSKLVGAVSYDSSKTNYTMANPTTGYFTCDDVPETPGYVVYRHNMLEKGNTFKNRIKSDTTSVTFTNITVPDGATTIDVSDLKDGSVLAWFEGTNMYVTTVDGGTLYANEDSSYLFNNKSSLINIAFNNFNTSRATNMMHSFQKCTSVIELDLSNFDTSNITDMRYMFSDCTNLTRLICSDFDTSRVTDMNSMFYNCKSLFELDLSSFNTKNVTDMANMFYGCKALTKLNVSNFNTENVTTMYYMFRECNNLTSLDLSSFNTKNVTSMTRMFELCKSLTKLDIPNFDTSKVTNMSYMFYYCSNLTELNISHFNTSNVTDMHYMFGECRKLTKLDISNFDTLKVTDMSYMFYDCQSLTRLDLSSFNTVNVTDMRSMFYECRKLNVLNVSSFNTQKVKNMSYMFYHCNQLIELDVSGFNTSNVTDMRWMFRECSSLANLDVSKFDTSKVKDMSGMFGDCINLTELNVSHFNTSNVTDMTSMFSYCKNITELNVSNFDTSKVNNMEYMFSSCKEITELDLSNFNTTNVKYTTSMFNGCSKLSTIYVSGLWNMDNITSSASMFSNCLSLKGAVTYNSSKVDATMANYETGYLTLKQ